MIKRPVPVPGMVIRYDYLWKREQIAGRLDGAKNRPCAIVLTVGSTTPEQILVAAITHSAPLDTDAILIPSDVKRCLGLDKAPSWIVTDEINIVRWDDPGIIPATTGSWIYGRLPPKLVRALLDKVADKHRSGTLGNVER